MSGAMVIGPSQSYALAHKSLTNTRLATSRHVSEIKVLEHNLTETVYFWPLAINIEVFDGKSYNCGHPVLVGLVMAQ